MDFGEAIKALKQDRNCVQREGWNGKNMYIYLEDTFDYPYVPFIVMVTAQGDHQPGWLASQADMLAEDWIVVYPNGIMYVPLIYKKIKNT